MSSTSLGRHSGTPRQDQNAIRDPLGPRQCVPRAIERRVGLHPVHARPEVAPCQDALRVQGRQHPVPASRARVDHGHDVLVVALLGRLGCQQA